jgi:glycosyltransferase involved in cell wall biosynthesis
MKVLHLFSNWKVTGPAEPVMLLVGALRARGVNALFASCENPFGVENLSERHADDLGIDVIRKWHLRKHFENLKANWRDVAGIRKFIEKEKVDIVHCHMLNDHHVGGRAARKAGRRVKVIRSIYEAGRVPAGIRNRIILPRLTDTIITFSEAALTANRKDFGMCEECAWKIDGGVDLGRFNPRRVRKSVRERLGLPESGFVLGIVTRIQKRRRFDIMLEAVRRAREIVGDFTFMVVGRGSNLDKVLLRPAKKLGISDMVRHTGFLSDTGYVEALSAMDAKIFLGGGTDHTSRAVREALAMGRPIIAGNTGMLPELVHDGETGLVVDMKAEDVAYAICRLARDELMRVRMGRKARAFARGHFDMDRQARAVRSIYKKVLGRKK